MFHKVISIICAFTLFASTGYADCSKSVYYLLKDEKAPCTGYLFSPAKELELRLLDTEHKYLKKELEIKDKMLEFYKNNEALTIQIIEKERQKSEMWRGVAEQNTLTLIKTQDERGKRDWLFFVGGILCTVAAGYAIGAAAK